MRYREKEQLQKGVSGELLDMVWQVGWGNVHFAI